MANIDQTNVDLRVNGAQAKAELDNARKKVEEFEKAWLRAANAGDKALMGTIKKGLVDAKRELRQMESGTKAVERVFLQLNKATPGDLNKALKFLQSELKNIERGSVAWKQHTEQIKILKAELDKVNSEMRVSESLLTRMKNKINDWGAMAAGAVAAFSGVVMAGKKAVNTYAEMQQEEANVRKYTGMTEEEVNHLNEAFKKMDTRTSREELNKLAQEAGRLGLQSEEDVLGFVKAADKINVALDDLGEGATLTLSKLTDIFGDKQALGTERSLLAVGSVINELSQNSTAAAPYLAEFAQRLAGVGAQAHMTIPEIMGFGAVLDSQGQKLEMSSTALSKVIMNLFKDPAKIANATGLAVEEFSETCKRSTNEGLLMLLDRLHELGGIDSLAPVFADMGENGARASAVLAALAGNVDMVRQQQEAANVAFNEAVSIDKEFNVQNTTVQAGLEKARKGFTEMAVTLGKELMPIVSKLISGTSMTMRLMLKVIEFTKEHTGLVITLSAALAAYAVGAKAVAAIEKIHAAYIAAKTAVMTTHKAIVMATSLAYNKMTGNIGRANAAHRVYNATVQSSSVLMKVHNGLVSLHKTIVLAASVAYNKLTGNTLRANAAQKLLKATAASTPWGAVLAGVTALVVGIIALVKRQREAAKAADENRKALERQQEAEKRIASSVGEVVSKYESLRQEWKRLSSEQEKKAWLEKNKEAFEQLGLNINSVIDADDAFVKNTDKVIAALKARAKAEALQDLYKDKMKSAYERAAEESQSAWNGTVSKGDMFATSNTKGDFGNTKNADVARAAGLGEGDYTTMAMSHRAGGDTYTYRLTEEGAKKVNEYYAKMAAEDAQKLTEQYAADVDKIYGDMYSAAVQEANAAEANTDGLVGAKKSGSSGGTVTGGGGGTPSDKERKAALDALEDWMKQQQAIENLAYAKGDKSYSEHIAKNEDLEREYHERRLALMVDGTTEYYQEQAKYESKLRVDNNKKSLNEQESFYADEKRCLDDQYMSGQLNHQQYTRALEEAELDHLNNVLRIYKEGSEEYIQAQKNLQNRQHEIQMKRFDEYKKIEDAIKKSYFTEGYQRTADNEEYAKQSAALEQVHQQLLAQAQTNEEKLKIDKAYYEAKYLLAKEYNQKEIMENIDGFRAAGDEIMKFLESDLGKNMSKAFGGIVNQMSSIFSSLSDYIDADTKEKTQKIEERYQKEIEAAGENKALVTQINKEKEEEIAKVNTEAANKKFNMQVIEAVANGIEAAVAAWTAGWETGPAGVFLAPAFMAMSLTATGIQIAALKKQRDQAASTGYASGGYTKPGRKYEPAGIVHAGEWVASQDLLANPTAAATIAQLDQAQRTNTIGQLSKPSPALTSSKVDASTGQSTSLQRDDAPGMNVGESIDRLNKTLDNGIYAATTMTGDNGILRQQRRYEQLMRNKGKK